MIPNIFSHLVVDERRKLPVPFQHMNNDGTWDYTALIMPRVQECIDKDLCGLCGRKLDWWKAFLSGPMSAVTRVYSDPPMHEQCVTAALSLCPHLMRANMKRAKTHVGGVERADNHPDAIVDRPPVWVMAVTRKYHVIKDSGTLLFQSPQPFKRLKAWRNREDQPGLDELAPGELGRVLHDIEVQGYHYRSMR